MTPIREEKEMSKKGAAAYSMVWETKKIFRRDQNETEIQEDVIINCLSYQIFSNHLTNYCTTRGHKARQWKLSVTIFIQQVVKMTHSEVKQSVCVCNAGQQQGEVQTLDFHTTALFRDTVDTSC